MVGDDVRLLAVHLASRLLALAGPGEILAPATARDLAVVRGLRRSIAFGLLIVGLGPERWREQANAEALPG
jgi:class 3 adenylate cyclase